MIVIALFTYDRLDVAKRTLESVAANLVTTDELRLHIADDGSSQEYRDELVELGRRLYGQQAVTVTNSQQRRYGGNYNEMTQVVHQITDLVLPLEDDWELVRPLDIDPIARVLRSGLFGCVRMGRLSYTYVLKAKFVWAEDLHWLELDPESEEHHVFAGGPRLETVEFERAVGPWPEGLLAGETEVLVSGRPAARHGIAWPVSLILPPEGAFAHIGAVKADKELASAGASTV